MNRGDTSGEHLLLVLHERLTLVLLETFPPREFDIDGVRFQDSGLGDFTGFYDWLRDASGRPTGVRYCPDEAVASRIGSLTMLSYVRQDGPCIEIAFGSQAPIDYSASDDQAFGGNRVFIGAAGEFALSFETYFLGDDELRAIREAPAHWGSLIIDHPSR
jgi:hypothetical protein